MLFLSQRMPAFLYIAANGQRANDEIFLRILNSIIASRFISRYAEGFDIRFLMPARHHIHASFSESSRQHGHFYFI